MITSTSTIAALALAVTASAAPAPVDVPPLKTKWAPADLAAACEQAEKDTDAKLLKLVSVPDDKRTFADSFGALDEVTGSYGEAVARLSFMKDIHTDGAVRDAGAACEERAGKYAVALAARKDLYAAMKGYLGNAGKTEKLDAEQQRLVDLTMLEFKRNGLELKDADLKKLIELRQKLTELQTKFQKNLNEDKTTLTFTKDELAGTSDDFIKSHEAKDAPGKYTLSTKTPDYVSVMENASSEATRKKMEIAYMNKGGKENLKLLDEAVVLRAKAAKLLGYKKHADYVAEDRMAKDSKTIEAFLARMKKGLEPGLESDRQKMLALKIEDTKDKKAVINAWDWRYYMSRIKKRDFAIDDEAVRQYFPADKVMSGMFNVYSTLFGITLKEVAGAEVWSPGVKLYEVRDAATKNLLAKFYVDLHPREGKYGHAAEFTLSPGHATDKGGYSIPMAALVVNFNPPQNGKPSLLSIKEVETMFHEFGHVMHESLTTARFRSLAGTRTALDFVEAPSQMLENWAYHKDVLAQISSGMPAEMSAKLTAARKYNAGVHYSRQVFLGSFDQAIHSADKADSDKLAKKHWADILKFPEDKSAHFAAGFGHMMGGYDGGYYGYLWSEVFAADMFTRFQSEGVLNPKVGREYRDRVISRGRTVDPEVLLKDFLGRAPTEDAFLKLTGIKPAS